MCNCGDFMSRYRIRGIYATALTKIFLNQGHEIVQTTPIIAKRLNIEQDNRAPDATIKDSEEMKDSIVVIGFPDAVKNAINLFQTELPHTIIWRNILPLHAVVRCKIKKKINDTFIADIDGKNEGIIKGNYRLGDTVYATIVRPPIKIKYKAILANHVQIVGYYSKVIYGRPRITLSEFIKNKKQCDDLLALGMKLKAGRWGIHWRSSARFVDISTLTEEVQRLLKVGEDVLEKLRSSDHPAIVYENEQMAEILIPLTVKEKLDEVRHTVTPTIKGHHWAKAMGRLSSAIVDFSEFLTSKGIDNGIVSKTLMDFVLNIFSTRNQIRIAHMKVTGEIYELTPGKVKAIENGEIIVERRLRKYGMYDGLGAQKSPGDFDFMKFKPKSNFLIHKYYTKDGRFIGTYVNINTPIEVTFTKIKYTDLLVDVVCKPGENPNVIDYNELEKVYLEKHYITKELFDYASSLISKAKQIAKDETESPEEYKKFVQN